MKKFRVAIVLVGALLICQPSEALVIYNNFTEDETFINLGWTIGRGSLYENIDVVTADYFGVDNDYKFTGLDIPIQLYDDSEGPAIVDLSLRNDNSGVPGSTLEEFRIEEPFPTAYTPGVYTSLVSNENPILHKDQKYWLVASTPNPLSAESWLMNDSGVFTNHLYQSNNSGIWYSLFFYQGAMRVYGESAQSPNSIVPEPSTILLLSSGLGAMALRRRRVKADKDRGSQ